MSSVEIIKKSNKVNKIQSVTMNSLRLYIPQDIRNDSQFPLKEECIASLIKIKALDGSEKVGVFFEPIKEKVYPGRSY